MSLYSHIDHEIEDVLSRSENKRRKKDFGCDSKVTVDAEVI
jgi:hypothetical protein